MPFSSFPQKTRNRNEAPKVSPALVLQSLQAKQRIISELIAGKLGLFEAASRFQQVVRGIAVSFEIATGVPSIIQDNENVCRTVIGWVHLALENRPEEAERITERLERELQICIDRFGTVDLVSTR